MAALNFLPQEIIRKKRDGMALTSGEIEQFVSAIVTDEVSDSQIAAFAMATLLNGMSDDETVALTLAMRDSGNLLNWQGIAAPISDKHSTGGVGDNVSLMLAPILAACGVAVPMISGRGLGHTGGTLDKLESIPGYQCHQSEKALRLVISKVGCAIIGQTGALAPADKRIYAVRDVTATVESIPLITASILSKKLAAGLETLVLDVKYGNGAFMPDIESAEKLAQSLVRVGHLAGLSTKALLTDMNEPLANCAGNGLEVRSAVDFLLGKRQPDRLYHVTMALAAEILLLSKKALNKEAALSQAQQALETGRAADFFDKMIHALGGPENFCAEVDQYLPTAPIIRPVLAKQNGFLSHYDARKIGLVVVALGGGRKKADDFIDHSVGISDLLPIGSALTPQTVIGKIHATNKEDAAHAQRLIEQAIEISDVKPLNRPIIGKIIV